jgi:hypothetical protein
MDSTQNVTDILDSALNNKRSSQLARTLTLVLTFISSFLGFATAKQVFFTILDTKHKRTPQIAWSEIQKQRKRELLISQIYNTPRSYSLPTLQ